MEPSPEYERCDAGGRTVVMHRDWLEHRELLARSPEELRALPGARVVRDAPHAIVIRLALRAGAPHVYYKRYRAQGLRGWLRSFIAQPPGERLWRGSLALRDRGFCAPLVVAYGHRTDGWRRVESFSVTAAVEPALAGPAYLRQLGGAPPTLDRSAARRDALRAFGAEIRRLHDSGVAGSDLRWENILIRLRDGRPDVVFLEQERLPTSGPISLDERIRNLVQLNMVWEAWISRSDRLQVLAGYEGDAERRRGLVRRVEARTIERMVNKIRRTTGVAVRPSGFLGAAGVWSRRYRPVRHRGWRGFVATGYDDMATLDRFISITEGIRAGLAAPIKQGQGRTAATMMLAIDGRSTPVYVKQDELARMGARKWLKDNLQSSRPWVTWRRTLELRAVGVAVQRPVAVLEQRRWGLIRTAVYVGEYAPDAVSIALRLQERAGDHADREAWLATVADELRRMHDRGYYHRDLKVGNVLAEPPTGRRVVIFIDLEGAVARPRLTAAERAIDLGRLWLSLEPWTTPEEREGLLERYRMTRPALDAQALRHLIDQRVDGLRARRFDPCPSR